MLGLLSLIDKISSLISLVRAYVRDQTCQTHYDFPKIIESKVALALCLCKDLRFLDTAKLYYGILSRCVFPLIRLSVYHVILCFLLCTLQIRTPEWCDVVDESQTQSDRESLSGAHSLSPRLVF